MELKSANAATTTTPRNQSAFQKPACTARPLPALVPQKILRYDPSRKPRRARGHNSPENRTLRRIVAVEHQPRQMLTRLCGRTTRSGPEQRAGLDLSRGEKL